MAETKAEKPRTTRAADPTARAKKAAAKVRKATEALSAALGEATQAGINVALSVAHHGEDPEESPREINDVTGVAVTRIVGELTL